MRRYGFAHRIGLCCVDRGIPAEGGLQAAEGGLLYGAKDGQSVVWGLQAVGLQCVAREIPAEGGLQAAEGVFFRPPKAVISVNNSSTIPC